MDYKDIQAGFKPYNFWFKAKTNFIGILIEKLNLNKDISILNIGSGTGSDIIEINRYGKVTVLDINKNALDLIPDDLVENKILADACNIPLKDKSFDLVLALDVLEHIKDDYKVISEIKRILKNNGRFIFTVPAYNFLFSSHDSYLNHFRRYDKKTLKNLLKPLKKLELSNWFFVLFLPAAFIRLIHKNKKYKPQKIGRSVDFLGNKILKIENFLFKKGIRYPWGLSFYGIYEKK